ncbi:MULTISPECIES: response regulator transcription factor [unclassified Oceanobacter]|jgi:DNA-binding NarL/FixJ family response regulator|uniref:response regulator n=2 Tax=Gammaproteobacteria TaxID=1236 RepID=UPI0026E48100|nr:MULTISPECIES: response regulator transcription factor [unclassified Oceanobacter]MDO6682799.1 response regulator transcription factor [Oceanobacter sp. 5_MG-2023]MDP2504871.1 response regulator transcription factor [Oceanobacter sp. 3_MG-2023]MDP2546315.1 response regulator transcription factor [Oceanobacter sp. 4_MG-2023]MDP2607616.1 response regulator transcription factor [Oceanobacter sp. 1_MG-2023]MDP2610884.1 response regulator transcription factor [Oceanobacter sp. 2_MG-2023]
MNILVVDDHGIVRQGCAALLSQHFRQAEIVEVDSGEAACQACRKQHFDLVVVDYCLPGISGIETCRRLLQHDDSLRILFFSMFREAEVVRQAISVGALGYVCKSSSSSLLVDAARSVMLGRPFVEHELSINLVFRGTNLNPSIYDVMTPREFEVLVMMAAGKRVQDVAVSLSLSSKTISNYVTAIKSKLGVRTDAELVHKAIELGVIRIAASLPA